MRANRCGSTAIRTCPALLPDRLVYSLTAVACVPPGSIRFTIAARSCPAGGTTASTVAAPTRASATALMLATLTDQIPAAKAARANAVASTIVVRIPPGLRATCRRARNGPIRPLLRVVRNPARQAMISSRDAATATAMPSSPGSSRPSTPRRAEPIWPLTRSSMSPATAAVMRMASSTQPRCAAPRLARCHCSTTGRLSVRRAAVATAATPPAVATAAATQEVPGSPTGVPGRKRMCPSPVVIAQPASTPTGSATPSRITGSARLNVRVRHRPRPRILASATSGPRASAASATIRNSSSHASSSSCAVISTTGTSIARQLARIVPSVAGRDVVVVAPSPVSCRFRVSPVAAVCTSATSLPVRCAGQQREVGVIGALDGGGDGAHRGQRGEHRVVWVPGPVGAVRRLVGKVTAARVEPVPGSGGCHGDLVLAGDDQVPPGRHGDPLAGVPVQLEGQGPAHRHLARGPGAVAGREAQVSADAGAVNQRNRLAPGLHRGLRGHHGRPEQPGQGGLSAEVAAQQPAGLLGYPGHRADRAGLSHLQAAARGGRGAHDVLDHGRLGCGVVSGPDADGRHRHHGDQQDVQRCPGAMQQSAQRGEQAGHDERS